jgi:hypothetical protein
MGRSDSSSAGQSASERGQMKPAPNADSVHKSLSHGSFHCVGSVLATRAAFKMTIG